MPLLNPKQFEKEHLEKIRALEKNSTWSYSLSSRSSGPPPLVGAVKSAPRGRMGAVKLIALDAHSVNVVTDANTTVGNNSRGLQQVHPENKNRLG